MRHPFHPLLLLSLSLVGCALKHSVPITRNDFEKILSDPNRKPYKPDLHTADGRAFATEAAANIVVSYSGETMKVRRDGPHERNSNTPSSRPSKLIHYFDSRPYKDLVVVIFNKNVWSDSRLKSEIVKTNRYFFARGYHRVVIQQATGASRPTHSDITAPSS